MSDDSQSRKLRRDVFFMAPHRGEESVGFGGGRFFSSRPSYERSYLLASQLLYRSAASEELLAEALTPLLYLHRHIVELCLKDAIGTAIRYLDTRNAAGKEPEVTIPAGVRRAASSGHDLEKLLSALQKLDELMDFSFLQPPQSLLDLVDAISGDEAEFRQKGTVHRYAESLNHSKEAEHFAAKSRRFPIHDRQRLVERMFEEMMGDEDEDFYQPESYTVSIALEAYALNPHGEF